MKLAASTSVLALALAGCATVPPAPVAPAAIATEPAARTTDGARDFIARVEKDLFGLSLAGAWHLLKGVFEWR